MTDDPAPPAPDDERPDGEIDDALVRQTADELRACAERTRRVEFALVAVGALVAALIAAFTGYNTYRLRDVNRNVISLVRSLEANQADLQRYNEGHAESVGENFAAQNENIRCFTTYFAQAVEASAAARPLPPRAALDACFRPPTPTPPRVPLDGKKGHENP